MMDAARARLFAMRRRALRRLRVRVAQDFARSTLEITSLESSLYGFAEPDLALRARDLVALVARRTSERCSRASRLRLACALDRRTR